MTDGLVDGIAVQELATAVADAVEEAIIGKREAVELFALLADGHVLIEDLPGLGKTLLARSFAQVRAMDFARIQFTLTWILSDITGASICDCSSGSYTFERGPIFAEHPARRRDQPRAGQDAGRIARGDGRTAGNAREHDAAARVTSSSLRRRTRSSTRTYLLPEAQLDRLPRPHPDRLPVGGCGARHPPRTLPSTARADRARARL